MTNSTRKNFLLCLALLGVSAVTVSAQSDTAPMGYFTVNIAAGTGTTSVLSTISFPLQQTADSTVGGVTTGPAGQMVGQITGLTASTITNSNAGWTAGQLSVAATPYYIQFTSGAAAGRTFLLSTATANTSTTVTLDPADAAQVDLTTLGIVPNTDTYEIIQADTLSSLFGTPATSGILGGTTYTQADQIQILATSGASWLSYYYNTTSNQWLRVGPPIPSNNVVVRPDTGVVYLRLANTPLSLVLMGRAPTIQRQATVSNTGITVLSTNFPVDNITLQSSGIQNLAGWASGATSSVADSVQIFNGSWLSYYYNSTSNQWLRVGPPIPSNSTPIPAGSLAVLVKRGSAPGTNVLTQALPYSL